VIYRGLVELEGYVSAEIVIPHYLQLITLSTQALPMPQSRKPHKDHLALIPNVVE
jgi:hypothetical protein